MSSSGTFAFAPSVGEITLLAFSRAGVRRTAIDTEELVNARMEINMLLAEWSNRQINLFDVVLTSTPIVAGTAAYNVAASTVMILDAYLALTTGDRALSAITRSEFAAMPNKNTAGTPSLYWFNRQVAPTLTLWPVPNEATTLKYYRVTQVEDANLPNGETPAVPYRWLDALTAGLAHRLARIYTPALEAVREADAMKAWQIAADQDVEGGPVYVQPQLGSYYR